MAKFGILKWKFNQNEILMVLPYIYHTLDDVIIILYVPLNLLLKLTKCYLKNGYK